MLGYNAVSQTAVSDIGLDPGADAWGNVWQFAFRPVAAAAFAAMVASGSAVVPYIQVNPLAPQWHLPNRAPSYAALSPVVAGPVGVYVADPGRWLNALSEPVRLPVGLKAHQQLAFAISPEAENQPTDDASDWDMPLSEPYLKLKGLGAWQQPFFTISPEAENQPEDDEADWFRALSEPYLKLKGLAAHQQQAHTDGGILPVVAFRWYQDLSQPYFGRYYAAADQPFFTISPFALTQPSDVMSNWFRALSEPYLIRTYGAWLQPFFTISPEAENQPEDDEADWFRALSEPYLRRIYGAHLQPFYVSSTEDENWPTDDEADWFMALSEPVRLPVGLKVYLQRDHTDGGLLPVTAYRWFEWLSEPYAPAPRGLGAWLQPFFTISPEAEAQPEDDSADWDMPLSEPVRFRHFLTALQSFTGAYGDPYIPPFEVWYDFFVQLASRPAAVLLQPQYNGRPPMSQTFGSKTPYEKRCFTCDFTKLFGAGEEIIEVLSVSLTVVAGVDPAPNDMLFGLPSIGTSPNGNYFATVGQWLLGGIAGCTYRVSFKVRTNITELVEGQVLLPVVAAL